MVLSNRRKLTIIPLLLYWPAIFIVTHIPDMPSWISQAGMSDKGLHYVGYLVLVFLMWFAISPYRKVNWRRASVWSVLLVMVWYGALDEWLQGIVRRNPDIMDFFSNLAGALTGLIVLSVFSFQLALLLLMAIAIFVLTNFTKANIADLWPAINAAFHFIAYGFFTILWIRYMNQSSHFETGRKMWSRHLPLKAKNPKWLVAASAVPIGFLLVVRLMSLIFGRGFGMRDVAISCVGIASAVLTVYLTAFFRRHINQRLSTSKS